MGCEVRFVVAGEFKFSHRGKLSNVLYKYIRNPLIHEGDASDEIVFTNECKFGNDGERFIVIQFLILGLVLVVIGDAQNSTMKLERDISLSLKEHNLNVNSLWGAPLYNAKES